MFAVELGDGAQLRPLQPWQAEEFLAHMDRAREYVGPWITWADRNADLESARATLQDYADKQARDEAYIYGIWLDGTLVGGVIFVQFSTQRGACEIGCWLEPAGAGRGLVTKAARVLVDWAFGVRGMNRAEWRNGAENTRSSGVAKRLGMRLEGVLREAGEHRGVRYDQEIWSLLNHEWRERA